MNVLVAFDKFKDSMSAAHTCNAAAKGIAAFYGDSARIVRAPLTDGGEGFCQILTEAASGYVEHHTVCGPLGHEIQAPLGWVEATCLPKGVRSLQLPASGKLAIIEMAAVAGLEQVPITERHPKYCTTRGVGELIRIATAEDASAILIGIGGSATSDLGLGALEALGLRFLRGIDKQIEQLTPAQWEDVTAISGDIELSIPPIFIACDVNNPLLGPNGAATVYGPQKGLFADEIPHFDNQAKELAEALCEYFSVPVEITAVPGSGAAGGIGFGLKVACGAEYVPGFELVSHWLDLGTKVSEADLILSGEGKLDASSLCGKGPLALAQAAHAANKACLLFAGKVEDGVHLYLSEHFDACKAYCITPPDCELRIALEEGPLNLERCVQETVSKLNTLA